MKHPLIQIIPFRIAEAGFIVKTIKISGTSGGKPLEEAGPPLVVAADF